MSRSYEDLLVWQKAVDLAADIYELTSKFPPLELYGIAKQIRKTSVSVASNIAEGNCRLSKKEFAQFLSITLGSVGELKTQIIIAERVKLIQASEKESIVNKISEIDRMTKALLKTIKSQI